MSEFKIVQIGFANYQCRMISNRLVDKNPGLQRLFMQVEAKPVDPSDQSPSTPYHMQWSLPFLAYKNLRKPTWREELKDVLETFHVRQKTIEIAGDIATLFAEQEASLDGIIGADELAAQLTAMLSTWVRFIIAFNDVGARTVVIDCASQNYEWWEICQNPDACFDAARNLLNYRNN